MSMHRRTSVILLLLVVATTSGAQTTALNNAATVKVGDISALYLHSAISVRQDLSDPTAVTYEADSGIISVEIFGTTSNVERAKDMVSRMWTFIQAVHIPYMKRRFGVDLTDQSFRIMYYDRSGRPVKLVLKFAGGQYIMAP